MPLAKEEPSSETICILFHLKAVCIKVKNMYGGKWQFQKRHHSTHVLWMSHFERFYNMLNI